MQSTALIERAQFAYNPRMYAKDGFADVLHKDGFEGSWLDWLLKETETSHGELFYVLATLSDRSLTRSLILDGQPRFGDTTRELLSSASTQCQLTRTLRSPDEHPFTPYSQLPTPILPPLDYPPLLYPNDINVNSTILKFYITSVVPTITRTVTDQLGKENDDGNYGSAGTRDLECLQAISRRIHCG